MLFFLFCIAIFLLIALKNKSCSAVCGAYRRKLSEEECYCSPPNKKRVFCHSHFKLEHRCKAFNKTTKKFCDNVIEGELYDHCDMHSEYQETCVNCIEIVMPKKLFCCDHSYLTEDAELELLQKKSYHTLKSVIFSVFFLCYNF